MPFKPAELSWKQIFGRTWQAINSDRIFGRSAELAYYFFLAIFPLLIFLMTILGMFAGAGHQIRASLFQYMHHALPPSAASLVQEILGQIVSSSGSGKMSFGIIASLWTGSVGMAAIMDALNSERHVAESRPYWKQRGIAIALTIAAAILFLIGIVIVVAGDRIAQKFSLGGFLTALWKVVQWPVALFFVLLVFEIIYYFGPDLQRRKWRWITPGALAGLLLWLAISFALRVYLRFFNTYSATYGALGAVIILLLWFYLTGAAILIGGEINTVFENTAAHADGPGAPRVVGRESAADARSDERKNPSSGR